MDDVLEAICSEKGVFLRWEAEELGYHDTAIARLVRDGSWVRVRRGAYTTGPRWTSLDAAGRYALFTRATVRQAKTSVVLSHISALPEYGAPLWGLDLTRAHLTRLDGRTGRKEAGVQQHQGLLLPDDVTERNGVAVVSATRAALEVTTVAETEPSLCVIDNLLNRGLTTPKQLAQRYVAMNSWPNTLKTDLVLRLADGRAQSVGETRARFLCWLFGLPAPIPQYPIVDEHGNVIAYVDLAWPKLGAFLEFDGRVKYLRPFREGETAAEVVIREKRREELICELTDWRCIRLIWSDFDRAQFTATRIRNVLGSGASAA